MGLRTIGLLFCFRSLVALLLTLILVTGKIAFAQFFILAGIWARYKIAHFYLRFIALL